MKSWKENNTLLREAASPMKYIAEYENCEMVEEPETELVNLTANSNREAMLKLVAKMDFCDYDEVKDDPEWTVHDPRTWVEKRVIDFTDEELKDYLIEGCAEGGFNFLKNKSTGETVFEHEI